MVKKGKKRLSLMAIVAITLTVLVACGGSGDDTVGTNANDGVDDTSSEGSNSELVFWVDEGQLAGVEVAIAEFEAMHNVTIRVEERAFGGQLEDLRLDGPAGIGADVVSVPSDQIPGAAIEGLLLELDINTTETSHLIDTALQAQMSDGRLFGLPYAVETQILFYNRDLISSEDLPQSFDEWYELSQEFVANGQFGLLALLDQIYYTFGIMAQHGGYIFATDGDGYDVERIGLANAGSIAAMEYLTRFYGSGIFPAGMVGENGIQVLDGLFEEGQAAAVISGPWNLGRYADAGIDYGVAPLPLLSNGNRMASFFGVKGYSVSSFSQNQELAILFIEFLTNETNSIARYEATLELPAIDVPSGTNDVALAIAEQMNHLVTMPSIPEMGEIWAIDASLQTIATGAATPENALSEAVEHILQQIYANHTSQQ